MRITLIVPCGGTGERTGLEIPKQYLEIEGRTILNWTLSQFEDIESIQQLIISADNDYMEQIESSIPEKFKNKYQIVKEGTSRFKSIFNTISEIKEDSEFVMIHDAVRPYTTTELIDRLIQAAIKYRSAVPYLNPTDTIKRIDPERDENYVLETLDREILAAVQTPQIFERKIFVKAYKYANKNQFKGTDDSSILEYSNIFPKLIIGDVQNTKITTKNDIEIAKFLLKK